MKYDESIKVYRDNLVTLEFAEQKGRAEGKEEGRAEGKEETARNLKRWEFHWKLSPKLPD